MDPSLVIPLINIVSAIVWLCLSIATTKTRRRLNAERRELQKNPPMLKCNVCGITLLDDSEASRNIHILCVMGARQAIEAQNFEKMWAEAHEENRQFERRKDNERKRLAAEAEAKRKELEGPKKPVFRIEVNPTVKKTLGTYDNSSEWFKDSESGYYTQYAWLVYKDEQVIGHGTSRYKNQAAKAARSVVAVFKSAEKTVITA